MASRGEEKNMRHDMSTIEHDIISYVPGFSLSKSNEHTHIIYIYIPYIYIYVYDYNYNMYAPFHLANTNACSSANPAPNKQSTAHCTLYLMQLKCILDRIDPHFSISCDDVPP